MFERLVTCSEATREGAKGAALIPALCGCRACGTARLIAGPMLGTCSDCGADLAVLETPARISLR